MSNNSIPLTYSIAAGLDFNDTTEFPDEESAWKYSEQIKSHVHQSADEMRSIFNRNIVCITDSPYLAEPHSIFPIIEGTFKKSVNDRKTETALSEKNTRAIYQAIYDVSAKGGGTVVVPSVEGQAFYTSSIRLENNVNLCIEKGAILKFTTNTSLYEGQLMRTVYKDGTDDRGLTLTRFESVELMNYSPFIYCYGKKKHRSNRRRHFGWSSINR